MEVREKLERCRLCGAEKEESDLINMFTERFISEKINKLLPIIVLEGDPMPQCICSQCLLKLKKLDRFYNRTFRVDSYLRRLLPFVPRYQVEVCDPLIKLPNISQTFGHHWKILVDKKSNSTLNEVEEICIEDESNNSDDCNIISNDEVQINNSTENQKTIQEEATNNFKRKMCSVCRMHFLPEMLQEHEKTHTQSISREGIAKMVLSTQANAQCPEDCTYFTCDKCDKIFLSRDALTQHNTNHYQEKFLCIQCNIYFTCEEKLQLHKIEDMKMKNQRLLKKEKVVLSSEVVIEELKSVPRSSSCESSPPRVEDVRFFTCGKCDKVFYNRDSLIQHKATNCEGKFLCAHCDIYFYNEEEFTLHQEENLKKHDSGQAKKRKKDVASSSTEEEEDGGVSESSTAGVQGLNIKLYTCNKCGGIFTRKSRLTAHEQAHQMSA